MPIYDNPVPVVLTPDEKAERAARQIRRLLINSLNGADNITSQIRKAVADGGGKPAVAAKIGADTAEMQAAYNALKDYVETYSTKTVDDL